MSYSIIGDIYVDNNKVCSAYLDNLKILNRTRYSIDFDKELQHTGDGEHWYDINSFTSARNAYEKHYEKLIEKKTKLLLIKDSIDYYKLSENEKNDLLQDIEYVTEEAQEVLWKLLSCERMVGLCEHYSENIKEEEYTIKNVKIYIYAD